MDESGDEGVWKVGKVAKILASKGGSKSSKSKAGTTLAKHKAAKH